MGYPETHWYVSPKPPNPPEFFRLQINSVRTYLSRSESYGELVAFVSNLYDFGPRESVFTQLSLVDQQTCRTDSNVHVRIVLILTTATQSHSPEGDSTALCDREIYISYYSEICIYQLLY